MLVKPSDKMTEVRLLQSLKTSSGKVTTPSGRAIEYRLLQPWNAPTPISVMLSENVTEVNCVQLRNA